MSGARPLRERPAVSLFGLVRLGRAHGPRALAVHSKASYLREFQQKSVVQVWSPMETILRSRVSSRVGRGTLVNYTLRYLSRLEQDSRRTLI